MYLKNIKLKDFRSYDSLDLSFSPKINVIYGKNAQGKTNIIEAIYYFSSLKSHRFVMDRELIKEGKEDSSFKIIYDREDYGENELKINLSKGLKKELFKNNIKKEKTEFLGNFYSVLFSPEDLNLIKGEKALRRRFIDTDICQLRPNYYNIFNNYNNVLMSRNKILKENYDENLLSVYTKKLIDYGTELIFYRALYIERLKETAKKIYSEISDDKRELKIEYKTFFQIENCESKKEIKEKFEKVLEDNKEEEILRKVTLLGPHKDDIEFILDDKNSKIYASQGQQRTIILSLKLSEVIFIKELTGIKPVILLDDILSELDSERQKRLFKYLNDFQTVLTVTDAHKINPQAVKMIKIVNSKVEGE